MVYMSLFSLILAFIYDIPSIPRWNSSSHKDVCDTIHSSISSSSALFFPGSSGYDADIKHWTNSSTQQSVCSVEPGTTDDLSTILKIIGKTRTPFAVKSGGHTANLGFSSTTGIEIALSRFSGVSYNVASNTIEVGAGMVWDDVYAALEPLDVIALGGRVTQVGVGGFVLGGGLSWKSQEYGLSVDTVVAFDLVLPNGTFTVVTNTSDPDLFFGLKGGLNNFGIVTKFTFNAFPQTKVWGGFADYSIDKIGAISKAIANFAANNTDPKAAVVGTYQFTRDVASISMLLFYDGVPSSGTPSNFDEFLAIPTTAQDLQTRSYLSMILAPPGYAAQNTRAAFHTVSVLNFTENVLNVIANESATRGAALQNHSEVLIAYIIEPYFGVEQHATPSAYPHDIPWMILETYYRWNDGDKDSLFISNLKDSVQTVYEAALAEGQDISVESGMQIRYSNYALADTPLDELYGANVGKLARIRAAVDPQDVMSLTGGFRIRSS